MSRSKRLVPFALFAACLAAVWAPKLTGAAPACDPDNGGIKLPAGFCALVVADGLGAARHMAVAPNGDLYVALMPAAAAASRDRGGVVALRDADGDGKFEVDGALRQRQHDRHRDPQRLPVCCAPAQRSQRFKITAGQLKPPGAAGDDRHRLAARSAARGQGHCLRRPRLAVHQRRRALERLPGAGPPARRQGRRSVPAAREARRHLEVRREQARTRRRQTARRFATGLRQMPAHHLARRRALHRDEQPRSARRRSGPSQFTAKDNAERPAEPLYRAVQGSDFGWPYCYFDYASKKLVLNPEYGGDGKTWAAARSSRRRSAPFRRTGRRWT